jgi:hypothetical protein
MALSVNILGPLVIESNYVQLEKVPRKARALLAYLAAQGGRAISRERLSDFLWPFQDSDQSRHSCLQDVDVDLERFEQLPRSSERTELLAAAELHRGELLADLVIQSGPFQEWLAGERDRTLDLISSVLQRLTALQGAAGEHDCGDPIGSPAGGARFALGDRSARADPRLGANRQAVGSAYRGDVACSRAGALRVDRIRRFFDPHDPTLVLGA